MNFDPFFYGAIQPLCGSGLNSFPITVKTFVSNRVSEIQSLTSDCHWRYVFTKSNPAELVSRSIEPIKMSDCKLWWHGPNFFELAEDDWPEFLLWR